MKKRATRLCDPTSQPLNPARKSSSGVLESIAAQYVQSVGGPVQERPGNRLGRRVSGKRVQVTLHRGGRVFFAHCE
jgi:hypothetical protein